MGCTVRCTKCKKTHRYLDDVYFGFKCIHCGFDNKEDTYERMEDDN